MAAAAETSFLEGATGRNTRGMLRIIILATIAAAAVSSRLFSVIRFESIIHECLCSGPPHILPWLIECLQLTLGSIFAPRNTSSSMASTVSGTGSMTVSLAPHLSHICVHVYNRDLAGING